MSSSLPLAQARALAEGGFIFWPKEFSLENYRRVFKTDALAVFLISVSKTVIGVVTHVFFCAMVGYGLSKNNSPRSQAIRAMGVITMFFSGGMIPTYLLIKSLGAAKQLLGVYYSGVVQLLRCRDLMNFFRNVPDSLEESAKIDGAGTGNIFLKIFIPLSMPAMARSRYSTGWGSGTTF